MTEDRLANLIAAALRAQRKAAFSEPVQRMDRALVDLICNRPAGPITITLPSPAAVDDEIRMAARNGNDDGLPPELLDELRRIEADDHQDDQSADDHDD